ncbi:Rhodanese-related sulfurtransferase [Modestobacter sp. DSM 44400]|uniref:rhodanese-like domain-containing protein n=1 Tax=Modestobacter sp. DSM 44400 TaxID=1550230 RepID=UPI000895DCBA|nr:rhodanese-like domain-containing protein [Modestobacter sp. DSM 44400]SDY80033.1 Rhodanese-related sulfurtransferase [Modestobacter sp. DSM 44400]
MTPPERKTLSACACRGRLPDLDRGQAAALLDRGHAVLLDARGPDEWATGRTPLAAQFPLGQLRPGGVAPGRPVIAACRSANRSRGAFNLLVVAGLPVHNVAGGKTAWAPAGWPVITDDGQPGESA